MHNTIRETQSRGGQDGPGQKQREDRGARSEFPLIHQSRQASSSTFVRLCPFSVREASCHLHSEDSDEVKGDSM